jgi:hypothetical protein
MTSNNSLEATQEELQMSWFQNLLENKGLTNISIISKIHLMFLEILHQEINLTLNNNSSRIMEALKITIFTLHLTLDHHWEDLLNINSNSFKEWIQYKKSS